MRRREHDDIPLDVLQFSSSDVAVIADIPVRTVQNWTDRGLADPYRARSEVRRGGGVARRYSLRDALRFYLMARLHRDLRIPLPQGIRICGSAFGDTFNPLKPGVLVLQKSTAVTVGFKWYRNEDELTEFLRHAPTASIVNAQLILRNVTEKAKQLLYGDEQDSSGVQRQG